MEKYRIHTGAFAAYRRAETPEHAMKLLYFRMRGVNRSLRKARFADATSSWTCEPATRRGRRAQ